MAEGTEFESLITQMDSFLADAKAAGTDTESSNSPEIKVSEQETSEKTVFLTPKRRLSARRYNEIVQEALSAPPKKRTSRRRAYKRSKSESLTQQQIISAVRSSISTEHQKLYNMFGALDSMKRGRITRKELAEGIASVANGLSEFEIKRFVRWVDTDQDGLISFQEFWQIFETDHTDKSKQTWYPRSPQTSPNSQTSMPSMDVFTQYQMTSPLQPAHNIHEDRIDLEVKEEKEAIPRMPKLCFVDHTAVCGLTETKGDTAGTEAGASIAKGENLTQTRNVLVTIHGARNIFAYTDTGTPRIVNVKGSCSLGEQQFDLPLVADTSDPLWNTTFTFPPQDDTTKMLVTLTSEEDYNLGVSSISIELGQEWKRRTFVLANDVLQDPRELPEVEISIDYEAVDPSTSSSAKSSIPCQTKSEGDTLYSSPSSSPTRSETALAEDRQTLELQEAKRGIDHVDKYDNSDSLVEDFELKETVSSLQGKKWSENEEEYEKTQRTAGPGNLVPWESIIEASMRSEEQTGELHRPPSALSSFLEPSSTITSPSSGVVSAEEGFTEQSHSGERLSNEEIAEMLALVEHYKECENENKSKLLELRGAIRTLKQQLLFSKDAQMKLRCRIEQAEILASVSIERCQMAAEETSRWKVEASAARTGWIMLLDQLKKSSPSEIILGVLSTILASEAGHENLRGIRSCVTYFETLEAQSSSEQPEKEAMVQNLQLELAAAKSLHESERELNHKHHEAQNVLKDQLQAALDDKRSCLKSLQDELEAERINWKHRESLVEDKIQAMELREHEFLSKEESLSKLLVAKSEEVEALNSQVKKLRYSLMAENQQKDLVARLTINETALAEEVSSLQTQCSSLQEQNQSLTRTVAQMRETMQRNEANCRELLGSLDAAKQEKKQLLKNLGLHIERIRELETSNSGNTSNSESAQQQLKLLKSKSSTLANENSEMEAKLNELMKDKSSLLVELKEARLMIEAGLRNSKGGAQIDADAIPIGDYKELQQRVLNLEKQIVSLFQKNQAILSLNTVLTENEKALKNRIEQLEGLQTCSSSSNYATALLRSRREVVDVRESIDKPAIKLLLADYAKAQDRTFSILLSLLRRSQKSSPSLKVSTKRTVACTVVGIDRSGPKDGLEVSTESNELLIKGTKTNRWFRFDRLLVTCGVTLDSGWTKSRFEPSEFLGKIEEGPFEGLLVCMGPTAGETTTQTISTLFDILTETETTYEITLSCIELSESREVFDLLKGPEVLKRLGEESNRVMNSDVDSPKLEDLDVTVVKVSSKREASLVAAMAASNRITSSAERRLSLSSATVEPNSHMILQVEVCRQVKVKEQSKFCIIELGCIEKRDRNPFLTECAEEVASLFNDETALSISPPSTKIVSLVRDFCTGQASLCAHVSFDGNEAVSNTNVLLALEFARAVRTEPITGGQERSRGAKVAKAILSRSELDLGVLHSLFLKWDRNQKGKLSRQEFRKGMYTLDRSLQREDVDDFFNASAEDGELGFHEFFKLLGEARKPIGTPRRSSVSRKKRGRLYQALSPEHARLVQPLQDLSHERRRASFNAYRVTKFQDTLRKYS